jgi:hypothetical protein
MMMMISLLCTYLADVDVVIMLHEEAALTEQHKYSRRIYNASGKNSSSS